MERQMREMQLQQQQQVLLVVENREASVLLLLRVLEVAEGVPQIQIWV
jgi:hypothetical protein